MVEVSVLMKTNNEVVYVADSAIHGKTKLIHEHDFITARNKEAYKHLVNSSTCGIYYCDLSGKALR
ncbi:MAG: hypothetical protein WA631_19095 [Nitrososphaeraceae archaeon]